MQTVEKALSTDEEIENVSSAIICVSHIQPIDNLKCQQCVSNWISEMLKVLLDSESNYSVDDQERLLLWLSLSIEAMVGLKANITEIDLESIVKLSEGFGTNIHYLRSLDFILTVSSADVLTEGLMDQIYLGINGNLLSPFHEVRMFFTLF